MQRLTRIFLLIVVLIPFLTEITNAQGSPFKGGASPKGNIIVISKYQMALQGDWDGTILDSLTNEYTKYCLDNNEYIISYRTIRHWWGHDSRDFILIKEYKNWDDIQKSYIREEELFRQHWVTKEQQDAFHNAYSKFFTGQHSDEIYRDTKVK
jgi:hypothetical protein